MSAIRAENVDLVQENAGLSAYIDSLMANIAAMGSKIAADGAGGGNLFKRFSTQRRSKVVKMGEQIGELQVKPEPRRTSFGGSSSPRSRASAPGGSQFDLASANAPMRLPNLASAAPLASPPPPPPAAPSSSSVSTPPPSPPPPPPRAPLSMEGSPPLPPPRPR